MTTQLYHMFMTAFATTKTMNTTVSNMSKPHGQINQAQSHSLFIMPPSDLLATPVSECLQETLLAIIIERHMKTQNLKRLTTYKHVGKHPLPLKTQRKLCKTLRIFRPRQSVPSCSIRHGPLLNSALEI